MFSMKEASVIIPVQDMNSILKITATVLLEFIHDKFSHHFDIT